VARHISTGIDIGTHKVRVVISERLKNNGSVHRKILGVGSSGSRGLHYGYIINLNEAIRSVREAVAKAEEQANIKVTSAYIATGGISLESIVATGSTLTSRADAEITEHDVERAIVGAEQLISKQDTPTNRKILHTVPLSYKIDGKEVLGRPQGMKGIKLEVRVLLITCLEQHLKDLIHAVETANIEIDDVIASPIAAAHVNLSKTQKIAGVVLANIGAETVSVVVYENSVPISLKIFPIGSTDITNDIALGFRIPLEDAEKLKVEGDTKDIHPRKKLDMIISARLTDIFELIETHLKKIKKDGLLPAGIVLTGGGCGIATIEDLARVALKLPSSLASVEHIQPQGVIKDSSWSTAYGLSTFGLQSESITSGTFRMAKRAGGTFSNWIQQFLP